MNHCLFKKNCAEIAKIVSLTRFTFVNHKKQPTQIRFLIQNISVRININY